MTDKECEIETSKAIMEMRNLIAELEKEKCELLSIIQGKDKVIQEFEKENAELKEQCLILADCNTCHSTCKNENVEMKKQLTKAKEIIKDYLTIVKGSHITVCGVSEENRTIDVLKLDEEAEQFIREEENDRNRKKAD